MITDSFKIIKTVYNSNNKTTLDSNQTLINKFPRSKARVLREAKAASDQATLRKSNRNRK